jgi:uncharacterized tellurite resistance protein B-like protein
MLLPPAPSGGDRPRAKRFGPSLGGLWRIDPARAAWYTVAIFGSYKDLERYPIMFDLFRKLIGSGEESSGGAEASAKDRSSERDVLLAACAVFLEMARIDNEFDEREAAQILRVFENEYGLSAADVRELEKASLETLAKSKDYWTLTNVINQHYTNEEKFRLVKLLWELVYADGKMEEHENYLMHKLARLLHLTHRDLVDAKLEVLHRNDRTEGATDNPTDAGGDE